jgi:hypothetical protein
MTGEDAAHDGEYVRRSLESETFFRVSWKVMLRVS